MNKQTKRALSLLLVLALSLAMCLPALAYEDTDPPMWEQLGCSSLDELLEYYGITPEVYYKYMVEPALEQQAQLQRFLDTHAEEYAAFDPYVWFEQEYAGYGYTSAAEYMEYYEETEAEFRQDMLQDWMLTIQEREWVRQSKVSVGGADQGVNVMVNGACIPYPHARPTVAGGNTLVPLSDTAEYLGAQVTRTADGVTVTQGDLTLLHTVGTATLQVTRAGIAANPVTMELPSYEQDGCIMVPLSALAQALDCALYWDEAYETAILLDRAAAAAEIDKDFTLLNEVLHTLNGSALRQQGQSLRKSEDWALAITVLDSLNGDKTYLLDLQAQTLSDESAIHLAVDANLGDLVDLYLEQYPYPLSQDDLDQAMQMKQQLSQVTLESIFDLQKLNVYLRGTLAVWLLSSDGQEWMAAPLEPGDVPFPSQLSLGTQLIQNTFPEDGYADFYTWAQMLDTLEGIRTLYGDEQFIHAGSSYTLKLNTRSLLRSAMDPEDWASLPTMTEEELQGWLEWYDLQDTQFELTLRVTPSDRGGTYTLSADWRTPELAFTADLTGSPADNRATLTFHVKNTIKGQLDLTLHAEATDQSPPRAPEAGSSVTFPGGGVGVGILEP